MSFRNAYVNNDECATRFLRPRFLDAAERSSAVERAAGGLAPAVLRALTEQNAALRPTAARQRHLEALSQPDVAVVVTGQQVGLFGGPLYSVHKAASAIALARRLSRETGRPVVPIFWLQTEDHDLAEIGVHRVCDDRGGVHRVAVREGDFGQRASVAHLALGPDVEGALDRLETALGRFEHADGVLEGLRRAYTPERGFAAAFATAIGGLFDAAGLLVLDPRTPELAAEATPLHAWALDEASAIEAILRERATALTDAGFAAQVPVRDACCLSFVHPKGSKGPRYRLRARAPSDDSAATWEAAGWTGDTSSTLTRGQLEAWLEDEPLRFSTSALLRPLLQDTWLPTAAYVGGPSEVAYFAQLAPLYEARGLALPLIVPRASWRWLPGAIGDLLERHGLAANELANGVDAALAELGARNAPGPSGDEVRRRLLEAVDSALGELDLSDLPSSVRKARDKTRGTMARYVGKLAERVDQARRRADGERLDELRLAHAWLFPDNEPQERTIGFASIASLTGVERFIERALEVADPVAPTPDEVVL